MSPFYATLSAIIGPIRRADDLRELIRVRRDDASERRRRPGGARLRTGLPGLARRGVRARLTRRAILWIVRVASRVAEREVRVQVGRRLAGARRGEGRS